MRPYTEHLPEIIETQLSLAQTVQFIAFMLARIQDAEDNANVTWNLARLWGADTLSLEDSLALISKCIRYGVLKPGW